MNTLWQKSLWQQFGAAIDMLDNALAACPDELWQVPVWPDDLGFADFWYVGYHTLFWLDLYLSGAVEGFQPPAPFTLGELDPAGVLPDRVYTKAELRDYLAHCRRKCRTTLLALTDTDAERHCTFGWGEAPFVELLIYNLRHVQEHAAQLNLFLGQQQGVAARWVAKAKNA